MTPIVLWTVMFSGIQATEFEAKVGLAQPAVSISVQSGEKLSNENSIDLEAILGQFIDLWTSQDPRRDGSSGIQRSDLRQFFTVALFGIPKIP